MRQFVSFVVFALILSACAGRSYNQLAAQTHLDMMDRGVVVVNLSQPPQLIEVRVYAPGMGTVAGPSKVYIQPFDSHAFVVDYAGGNTVSVSVLPVDVSGRAIGRLQRTQVSFPWGHHVGNAADYRRNHIMLYYERDGHLRH